MYLNCIPPLLKYNFTDKLNVMKQKTYIECIKKKTPFQSIHACRNYLDRELNPNLKQERSLKIALYCVAIAPGTMPWFFFQVISYRNPNKSDPKPIFCCVNLIPRMKNTTNIRTHIRVKPARTKMPHIFLWILFF